MNDSDRQFRHLSVEAIFQEAVSLSASERRIFLDRVYGDDAGLRRRVDALLAAHDDETGFLPGDDSVETQRDDSPVLEGEDTVSGRYKLLEKLGEGGFGSAWPNSWIKCAGCSSSHS